MTYCQHLTELEADISLRFKDLFDLEFEAWMIDPFSCVPEDMNETIQEEIIELKYNEEYIHRFQQDGISKFWQSKDLQMKFPNLWKEMSNVLLAFPTTYLVESGFSFVNHNTQCEKNRLEVCYRGDIRLKLSRIKPDIEYLASKHQYQGSH
ncbi:protein ZBED8-like [Octopus sinensis]|uniref:Protein ZBED8-like n=1 Tax=Octopus sinensis TaxID=2607531 RepID=A0A6P7TSJ2_9MOLL|nr:protein ZBED8-like [Octopus sinensis]